MLTIEIINLEKEYGSRTLFEIKDLKIYKGDKIGLVGKNGEGKSTLLNIIAGVDNEYSGIVKTYGSVTYMEQLEDNVTLYDLTEKELNKNKLKGLNESTMSGGERTKVKLISALKNQSDLLILDEPTSHLDLDAILELEKRLIWFNESLLLISHDKELLNNVCNKIVEIERGKVSIYQGNYESYIQQKKAESNKELKEYEAYKSEKKRLEIATEHLKEKAVKTKISSRMGNSEARLHRGGVREHKKANEKRAKIMERRVEHLEKKDKPYETKEIKLRIPDNLRLKSKYPIKLNAFCKRFDDRTLFNMPDIQIENNTKIGILGANGTGKSTLLKMIIDGDMYVNKSMEIKVGYFSQSLDILDENKSILDNVMETSIYDETLSRIILGNLLIKREEVHKKLNLLSGGERVKTAIAKIILSKINVLILDEPTNYLDIPSKEALIQVLKDYDGLVIIATHDRDLLKQVTNRLIVIEDCEMMYFLEGYGEYNNK